MAFEDVLNRFQEEIRMHIGDRHIFIIESLCPLGWLIITLAQLIEHFYMCAGMAGRVHGPEGMKLQKTWINLAVRAGISGWHAVDHVAFKPGHCAVFRNTGDRRC